MIECAWLHENDVINKLDWVKTDDEVDGSTPNICWVKNITNGKRALFKPDTFGDIQAYREYATFRIARFLEIPSAQIEVGLLFDKFGCLSYDCNLERRHRASDAESLYRCDTLFNNAKSDSVNRVYDSPLELSFSSLCQYITDDTKNELIRMMFLDCLVLNTDRHGGNYGFFINKHRAISGLMPLYDHGLCMRADLRDVSLFPYSGIQESSFIELFSNLVKEHLSVVEPLLNKIQSDDFKSLVSDLKCSEFILDRVDRFCNLVTSTQNSTHSDFDYTPQFS